MRPSGPVVRFGRVCPCAQPEPKRVVWNSLSLLVAVVLVVALAACAGGSGDGGWSKGDREKSISQDVKSGYSREDAECFADFLEKRYDSYADAEAAARNDPEEATRVAFAALAACDAVLPSETTPQALRYPPFCLACEGAILDRKVRRQVPTALDNGQRSPRKLLAAVVPRLIAALPHSQAEERARHDLKSGRAAPSSFLLARGLLDRARASVDGSAPGAMTAVVLYDLAVETGAKAEAAVHRPSACFYHPGVS